MIRHLSSSISYVLHPIFVPLISAFILFQLPIYYNYKLTQAYFNVVYLLITANLILVPLGLAIYLKRIGVIQSLKMRTTRERRAPFLFTTLLYFLTFYVLKSISFPKFYLQLFLASTFIILLLSILAFVNIKWSAHLSAMGGLFGMMIVTSKTLSINLSWGLIIVILISGLLASARLALNAHNLKEVSFGFLLGMGIELCLLL